MEVSRASGPQSSLQRALVVEFPDDHAVRQVADSFMFGPSFLVFPVLKAQETTHTCYLPIASGASGVGRFFDFWTVRAWGSNLRASFPRCQSVNCL